MSDRYASIFSGRSREQVLADAAAYGVDLSLVEYNRRLSVEQRLRMLDENVAFIEEIRRNRRARTAQSATGW
jgi:hypothetical protein